MTLSDTTLCAKFLRTLDVRPASFFVENVKSLCVPGDIQHEHAQQILCTCQGVYNLAIWLAEGPPLFPLISSLCPHRLSINVRGLFASEQPDFRHPFFSAVTHLELVDWSERTTWSGFEYLPSLTHLAIDLVDYTPAVVVRVRRILKSCQLLRVCLGLVSNDDAMIIATNTLSSVDDLRFVILSESDVVENWEASLNEASDACQWAFAEGIVASRESEFVSSPAYDNSQIFT